MARATRKTPVGPMVLGLALALHLLAFYLLENWSDRHHADRERPEEEVTISLLPIRRMPFEPEKPPMADKPIQRILPARNAQDQATAKSETGKSNVATEGAPSQDPADPIIPPSTGPLSTDPTALVKAYGYVDTRSELRKTIEAHGGTVEIPPKSKYAAFAEALDDAQIPNCFAQDGLRHDPPRIGPVQLGGEAAALFVVDAAIRGKCKVFSR